MKLHDHQFSAEVNNQQPTTNKIIQTWVVLFIEAAPKHNLLCYDICYDVL